MKQFVLNLWFVCMAVFVFYIGVVVWFNRPTLRRQLWVMTERNDANVSWCNVLNSRIRDLEDAAVEHDNVIILFV